jgi:hypothetical protein
MLDFVLALLTGIVIAAVSSWITVQLSLRRFRTERWWERKVEAYERIISALHDAKAFAETHLHADMQQRDVPDDVAKDLRDRSKLAQDEIAKAIDIGAFLLSKEALSRLKQHKKDEAKASEQRMWFEYLDADWAATDECLKDLIEIAKRDLKAK